MRYRTKQMGFSLVEAVVGTAVVLMALTGFHAGYSFFLKAGLKNTESIQATFLAEEGVEVVLLMRDGAWSSITAISTSTPFFLEWTGSSWVATTTVERIGKFTRTLRLENAYRRETGDLVSSAYAGTKNADANGRLLFVSVSSDSGVLKEMSRFIFNIYE